MINEFANDNIVVIMSGGMDSTIAMRIAVNTVGADKVKAISFKYGQRQISEIYLAQKTCKMFGVHHQTIDISFLGEMSHGFSANVDPSMNMPTIHETIGDPRPSTYVPNRNMIMLSIAAAYAETMDCKQILAGFQLHDQYAYHDTTHEFVDKINNVFLLNRKFSIEVIAPFSGMSKHEEIEILRYIDGDDGALNLLKNTLTCYNPNSSGESCGVCPSCSERIQAFVYSKLKDPIKYSIDIDWKTLIGE